MEGGYYGALSLLPIILALVLAFITKDAILALFIGCIVGVIILGQDPATGLSKLFQAALGNADFIWVLMIEVFIGILIAFFLKAGVTQGFADIVSKKVRTRRSAQVTAWLLGMFVFFSDYFSPLFTGTIMRPVTDRMKVSREKLAYLLDSTSAPVCTLIPISGWAVYVAGLLANVGGPISSKEVGLSVFINSIPYNFYGLIAVALAGLIAAGIIPDFGPMKRAEKRAIETGKVLRDGATPLVGVELEKISPKEGKKGNVILHLIVPVLIIVCIAVGTFIALGSTKILEAFIAATLYLAIILWIQGYFNGIKDMVDTALNGVKGVLPAITILALAYSINTVTKALGGPEFVLSITRGWMTPALLVGITFVTGALISFFSGTSWGTYAILTPFVIPLALELSNGTLGPLVYAATAAIVGGGVFGDHCSPVSDTTILSSFGSACDHMDHVITQMPYALTAALLALILYLIVGVIL